MEKSLLSKILGKITVAIIILALVDLVYLNWWVLEESRGSQVKSKSLEQLNILQSPSPTPTSLPSPTPAASDKEKKEIVETKTTVEKESQTIIQTAQKEIFIPIGSGSTFSNGYADLAGLEVTIDKGKYSEIESVVFEGSIWVQDGNGKVYAQLYNKTGAHPVWNSEISTSSASGVLTTSSKIALTGGVNTYKVQAKTNLTSYAAHVDNARIKITLR